MKSTPILWIKAVVAFAFGILLLLVPGQLLNLFGVKLDADGLMMTQLVGALDIGIGIMTAYVREGADTPVGAGVILSMIVQDVIGFIVLIIAELKGVANPYGWVIVVVNALFALALAYVRFYRWRPVRQANAPSHA